MKHFTLLLLLTIPFFSTAQLTNETITIGGQTRSYQLYVPVGFNATTETPRMLFILHGLGGTSSNMVAAGFNYVADTARVIVVYPQGALNSFGQASWNNGTGLSSSVDDISFFNALMDRGLTDFNVNPAKVFVTGFSMGSIMSHHLACALNNRIAAIGTMAGTMSTSDISSCNPTYKTPVIHLHGTADGTVPYDGTALPTLSLVAETMNFWRNVHNCDATADSTRLPDVASDNITVDRFVYDNCNPVGSVELWRLNNADHIYLYQPVNDITEMLEVWKFFNKWQHSSPSTLSISKKEYEEFAIYPNPTNEFITIESKFESMNYSILNTQGQNVLSGKISGKSIQLNCSDLKPGIYFVNVFSEDKTFSEKLIIE